jgi:hypothetical protein
MLLRYKALATGFIAAVAIGVVGVGAAFAGYSNQPVYKVRGVAIAATPFESVHLSRRARLWVVNQAEATLPRFVLTCERGTYTMLVNNKLEEKGRGKVELTFSECNVHKVQLTAGAFEEEVRPIANCTVENDNIKTTLLKTRAVWSEEHQTIMVTRYEPESGPAIATIKLNGAGCGARAGTYTLTGSMLGAFQGVINTPVEATSIIFPPKNGGGSVVPFYKTWRVTEGATVTNGEAKLTLIKDGCPQLMLSATFGASMTIELAGAFRPLFNVYE